MRLRAFMTALRDDVATDQRFELVPSSCAPNCPTNGPALSDRLRVASQAGTHILIVGVVHKMSTLVQLVDAAAVDTTSQRIVFKRSFTFRGDMTRHAGCQGLPHDRARAGRHPGGSGSQDRERSGPLPANHPFAQWKIQRRAAAGSRANRRRQSHYSRHYRKRSKEFFDRARQLEAKLQIEQAFRLGWRVRSSTE